MAVDKAIQAKRTTALASYVNKLDVGAQVGVQRNERFSAGGRTLK